MSLTATCAGTALAGMALAGMALAGMAFAGTVFVDIPCDGTPPCGHSVYVVVDTAAFIVVILAPF